MLIRIARSQSLHGFFSKRFLYYTIHPNLQLETFLNFAALDIAQRPFRYLSSHSRSDEARLSFTRLSTYSTPLEWRMVPLPCLRSFFHCPSYSSPLGQTKKSRPFFTLLCDFAGDDFSEIRILCYEGSISIESRENIGISLSNVTLNLSSEVKNESHRSDSE